MKKEIKRFPNYYISDNGEVWHGNKKLKHSIVGGNYHSVSIFGKRYMVHRLVAEEFIDGFDANLQVHHKDKNKDNNSVDNLECMSQKDHIRMHQMKNPLTKICRNCNKVFYPNATKRKIAKFCCWNCYKEWIKSNGR